MSKLKINLTWISLLILFISGCATSNTHNVTNTTQTVELNTDLANTYSAALRTVMKLDWEITMSDATNFLFSGKTPQTMQRWGDVVNVFLTKNGDVITITVKSRLGHSPNQEYIKHYLDEVKKSSIK